ncbi:MAG: hypothetical protein JWM95_2357 [Gemmatimonadetes bacterium]|nr:hypothetical protein [Gemmatimonadota bacterium]
MPRVERERLCVEGEQPRVEGERPAPQALHGTGSRLYTRPANVTPTSLDHVPPMVDDEQPRGACERPPAPAEHDHESKPNSPWQHMNCHPSAQHEDRSMIDAPVAKVNDHPPAPGATTGRTRTTTGRTSTKTGPLIRRPVSPLPSSKLPATYYAANDSAGAVGVITNAGDVATGVVWINGDAIGTAGTTPTFTRRRTLFHSVSLTGLCRAPW